MITTVEWCGPDSAVGLPSSGEQSYFALSSEWVTIHEELDDLLDFVSDMEPHPALIAWCDLRDVLGGHFYQHPLGFSASVGVLLFLNGPASLSHPSVYYYGLGDNIRTCCLGVLQGSRLVSYPRFVDVRFMVRSVRQAGQDRSPTSCRDVVWCGAVRCNGYSWG